MYEKKHLNMQSPDLNKLQKIVIDHKTIIFVPLDVDPAKARSRYLSRFEPKKD